MLIIYIYKNIIPNIMTIPRNILNNFSLIINANDLV